MHTHRWIKTTCSRWRLQFQSNLPGSPEPPQFRICNFFLQLQEIWLPLALKDLLICSILQYSESSFRMLTHTTKETQAFEQKY